MPTRQFTELPLGTRFRYIGQPTDLTWVILSHEDGGRVARWEGIDGPSGPVCSATNTLEEYKHLVVSIVG